MQNFSGTLVISPAFCYTDSVTSSQRKSGRPTDDVRSASGLKRDGGRNLYDWVGTVAAVALTAVIIFTFAVRLVLVDGPSMRETLQHGDCLAVLNAPLCGTPEAGDIVILRKESFRDGAPIVKRVIATEGQTVDIDFDAGTVFVDGELLEEEYVRAPTYLEEGLTFR